jgi:hypothetical protein
LNQTRAAATIHRFDAVSAVGCCHITTLATSRSIAKLRNLGQHKLAQALETDRLASDAVISRRAIGLGHFSLITDKLLTKSLDVTVLSNGCLALTERI